MDADLTLSADDTFSGQIVVGYSDEVMDELGTTPDEMVEAFGDETALSARFPTEPYSRDGYTGYRHFVEDMPIEDLADIAEVDVERTGDEFVVTGELAHQGLEDLGSDPDGAEMFSDLYYRMAITFPGPVGQTNGTVEGTTVTWESTAGEVQEMTAIGSALTQEELDEIARAEAEAQAEAERQENVRRVTIGVAVTLGLLVVLGSAFLGGRYLARTKREPAELEGTASATGTADGATGTGEGSAEPSADPSTGAGDAAPVTAKDEPVRD